MANSLESYLGGLNRRYIARRAATPTEPWEYESSVKGLLGQRADNALERARLRVEDETSEEQFNKGLAQSQSIADRQYLQQKEQFEEQMAQNKEQYDKTFEMYKANYEAKRKEAEELRKAQKAAAETQMITNLGTTAVSSLGTDLLARGGNSLLGKAYGLAKDAGTSVYNSIFGPSVPSNAIPVETPLSPADMSTGWDWGATDASGSAMEGLASAGSGATGGLALDVAAGAAPETISLGTTIGSAGTTGVVDMGAGWGMAEPLSTAGTSTGSTALGTAGNVLGNAALYYAAGKAVQGIGEKWHDNNSDVPYAMKQWGHNIQDATSLPFYTELGINEGAKTAKGNAGEEYRTYEDTGKGNTALALEGLMPADTGLLGETLRGTIDAAARFNTGDMLMKAGDIMAPMRTVAERAFGVKPGGSEVINYLANPIGEAYHDFKEHVCIIVTACTDRYSPEVEITRQYRDHFLTNTDLRGYYALAEKIVPTLQHNKKVNTAVKKLLVDKLIDYGSYRLGLKNKCRLSSRIISKLFLVTIRIIGIVIPQYTRANGEVY